MGFDAGILTEQERILFALRRLYLSAGYTLFKMSKFEEYDFYAQNKDFLISDNVITFTDAGGRLMALKPDVTLSIVRSCREKPGEVRKLCYNENVYRVPREGGPFRELTQAGLECIGEVGEGEIAETLSLALESLACTAGSAEYALSISHLGILSELLERLSLSPEARSAAVRCVEQKNTHELEAVCRAQGADRQAADTLRRLLRLSGVPRETLPLLREMGCDAAAVDCLEHVTGKLSGPVRLDFSIVSNLNYYNGVVFKGYVSGVPSAVLSGGQYDRLLRKLGRSARAIGFAVYVDQLERVSGAGEVLS